MKLLHLNTIALSSLLLASQLSFGQTFTEDFEGVTTSCQSSVSIGNPMTFAAAGAPDGFSNGTSSGCVSGWYSANGNPWVVQLPDASYPVATGWLPNAAEKGSEAALVYFSNRISSPAANPVTGSIYYKGTFISGHHYYLSYWIWVSPNMLSPEGVYPREFDVILTSQLVPTTYIEDPLCEWYGGSGPAEVTSYQTIQTMAESEIEGDQGGWVHKTVCFTPTKNYSELWFRPIVADDDGSFISNFWYIANVYTCFSALLDNISITDEPSPTLVVSTATACTAEPFAAELVGGPDDIVQYTFNGEPGQATFDENDKSVINIDNVVEDGTYHVILTAATGPCGSPLVFEGITDEAIAFAGCDSRSSQPASVASVSQSGTQQYSIAPDPNNGVFTLFQSVDDVKPLTIDVTDVSGRSVYHAQSAFSGKQLGIDLGYLTSGLYMVRLGTDDHQTYMVKCVVAK